MSKLALVMNALARGDFRFSSRAACIFAQTSHRYPTASFLQPFS